MAFTDFTDDDQDHNDDNSSPFSHPNDPANNPANNQSYSQAHHMLGGGQLPSQGGGDPHEEAKRILIDYNEKFTTMSPLLFRDLVVEQLTSVLISRKKPNALLVGPAGVGKTALVEWLAHLIATKDNRIPKQLQDYTIYELPISAIASGASLVGQLEQRVENIIDFATDPDNKAIIFMDEIHQLFDDNTSASKASQMLKPAMARGDIKVIGATTLQESKDIDKDPAFSRRVAKVLVDELNLDQTAHIVDIVADDEEKHFQGAISITNEAKQAVINFADAYLSVANNRPDNAITLLSRAASDLVVQTQNVRAVQPSFVATMDAKHVEAVANKLASGQAQPTQVDIAALEHDLERIVGQEHVTRKIPDLLRRRQLKLNKQQTPTVWMFAGPSGVGKTEIARIVGKHVNSREPIIVNMAEYASESSLTGLLGSHKGYVGSEDNTEMPFDKLITNPQQVVLFDEIEKAHKKVWQVLLSAFDSGVLKMANGREIDFSQAICILTTNAAKKLFSKPTLGFTDKATNRTLDSDNREDRTRLIAELSEPKGPFTTEFLGRCSLIIGFNTIGQDAYRNILENTYATRKHEVEKLHPQYSAFLPDKLDNDEIDYLVETSYHAEHGARPAMRAIERYIEDLVIAGLDSSLTTSANSPDKDDDDDSVAADDIADNSDNARIQTHSATIRHT
jgi:ATP-dependent Clp protease ATP-binding subunit ClpA